MLSNTILILQQAHKVLSLQLTLTWLNVQVRACICITVTDVSVADLLIDHLLDLACPVNGDGLKALYQVLQPNVQSQNLTSLKENLAPGMGVVQRRPEPNTTAWLCTLSAAAVAGSDMFPRGRYRTVLPFKA